MGFFGDVFNGIVDQAKVVQDLVGYFEMCDDDELIAILKGNLSPYRTEGFAEYEFNKKESIETKNMNNEGTGEPIDKYEKPTVSCCKMAVKQVAQNRGLIR